MHLDITMIALVTLKIFVNSYIEANNEIIECLWLILKMKIIRKCVRQIAKCYKVK